MDDEVKCRRCPCPRCEAAWSGRGCFPALVVASITVGALVFVSEVFSSINKLRDRVSALEEINHRHDAMTEEDFQAMSDRIRAEVQRGWLSKEPTP